MKKGDVFYIEDFYGTKSILKRTILDIVDGNILYHFRDKVIQKCPIEKFNFPKTELDAKAEYDKVTQLEISNIETKIQKLKVKKQTLLDSLNKPILDLIKSDYLVLKK